MKEMGKGYSIVYRYFWDGLDWIFPPDCGGCGKPGQRWCSVCDAKAQVLTGTLCSFCGQPSSDGSTCSSCVVDTPIYTTIRGVYIYKDEIREALHSLKYKNNLGISSIFAERCANYLVGQKWAIDLVVPVPLGKERKKERGFNQAAMIAYPLALFCGLSYSSKALIRSKETVTQIELSAEKRRQNVKGAFCASTNGVAEKNILVVDDIITTGSTMNECAIALKLAGAKAVYGISVARAIKDF
jgi:competence protein ComFC